MINLKIRNSKTLAVEGDITEEATKVRSMETLLKALEDLGSALAEVYHEGFIEHCLNEREIGEGQQCNIVMNVRGKGEVAKQVYIEIKDEFDRT